MAVDYPAPKDPGKLPPRAPNGGEATLHVCKKPRCFQTIQQAVNASRGGDTIKVANGTYKEGVQVKNARPQGPPHHRQHEATRARSCSTARA